MKKFKAYLFENASIVKASLFRFRIKFFGYKKGYMKGYELSLKDLKNLLKK